MMASMPLERLFDDLDIAAAPFALCELRGRCVMGMGRRGAATLHYILAGGGALTFDRAPPVQVEAGSLALVPAGVAHSLRSAGGQAMSLPRCDPAALALESRRLGPGAGDAGADPGDEGGDEGGGMTALCARVTLGLRGVGDVIDLVRAPIVARIAPDDPAAGAIAGLLRELAAPGLGGRALVRALLLQCMIHLLRARLLARDPALRWMSALGDERLWSALKAMLDQPGAPHSVEDLAEIAGMSRSTFAARFAAAYGAGPMSLLRALRLQTAAALLARSDMPVKRVAAQAGFDSRSAFSRAFLQQFGVSPGAFRAGAEGRG